jgi:hypothetical protein
MANRSDRKSAARPENLSKAFYAAFDQGPEVATALLSAKIQSSKQLAHNIRQVFGTVAHSRFSVPVERQAFITAWDNGGENAALDLLEQKSKTLPLLADSYKGVFAGVKRLANKPLPAVTVHVV